MTFRPIPLEDQISEAELHHLGLRDLHRRAAAGKIKRSPHEIERMGRRVPIAEAIVYTLKKIAGGRRAG